MYTVKSTKMIQNLGEKLDKLVKNEMKNWDSHVKEFLQICGEITIFDMEILDKEKELKLILFLSSSFSTLVIVSTITS